MDSKGKTARIKKVRQVCRCEKCGNEAEMEFTCQLEPLETAPSESMAAETSSEPGGNTGRAKGTATCTHCGNEAEMWVDI